MLAAQYAVPLPADYDMSIIRKRVTDRVTSWTTARDLESRPTLSKSARTTASATNTRPSICGPTQARPPRSYGAAAGSPGSSMTSVDRPSLRGWESVSLPAAPSTILPRTQRSNGA